MSDSSMWPLLEDHELLKQRNADLSMVVMMMMMMTMTMLMFLGDEF